LKKKYLILISAVAVSLMLITGCSKKSNPVSPFQPEVNNIQDNFQFQATAMENVSTSLSYTWDNSATAANIDQSCAITSGSAAIVISDDSGVEMYNGNLLDGGSFASSVGTAGAWTITLNLYNVYGTVNFRVQSRL